MFALAGTVAIVPQSWYLPDTLVPSSYTVTSQSAVFEPSAVVTVILAVPAPTAVTTPFATVATAAALVDHVTFLLEAFVGATVAVRVSVSLTIKGRVVLFKLTPVTSIISTTSTAQLQYGCHLLLLQ